MKIFITGDESDKDEDGEATKAQSDINAEAIEKEAGEAQSDSNAAEDTQQESGKTEAETGDGEGTEGESAETESEQEDCGVKANDSKDTLTSDSGSEKQNGEEEDEGESEKENDTCEGETALMDPSGKKDELDSDNSSSNSSITEVEQEPKKIDTFTLE